MYLILISLGSTLELLLCMLVQQNLLLKPQLVTCQWLLHFVETADCETDGYLSSSGLQDPLEAGGSNAQATPPATCKEGPPTANGFPIPALRFPSVSGRDGGSGVWPTLKI